MKSFTDTQGRTWTVEINYTSLRRVKAAAGVDLTRLVDPKSDVISRLTGDPFTLFDCLAAVLQPQLQQQGITVEQFGEALDEESAEKGAMALIDAVIDFFQEGKRMLLKRAFAKVKTAAQRRQTASIDEALKTVESPQFEQAIEESLKAVG